MATRGEIALARALAEWQRPTHEPPKPGWEQIDRYIRGPEGLGWTWEDPYTKNGQFMWCGAFAAWCYADLAPLIRRDELASTTRVVSWAEGTPRLLKPEQAQPGDIFTIGHGPDYVKPTTGKPEDKHGTHIGIVESVDLAHGVIATVEGNAGGSFPDGTTGDGVVKQSRQLPNSGLRTKDLRVKFIVRPLEEDFATPLEQATAAAGIASSWRPYLVPALGAGLVLVAGGVLVWRWRK